MFESEGVNGNSSLLFLPIYAVKRILDTLPSRVAHEFFKIVQLELEQINSTYCT
jgi:hypothetical protein